MELGGICLARLYSDVAVGVGRCDASFTGHYSRSPIIGQSCAPARTDNAVSRRRVPEHDRARASREPDRGPFQARSKSCKDGRAGTIPASHTRMANMTPPPSKHAPCRLGAPILAADGDRKSTRL